MPAYKKSFKGIIRSLEVTMNMKNFTMHPHIHCLVLVNKSYFTSRDYISHSQIFKDWGNIIGCKFPQVHLRKCTDLVSALCEVVKYASKPIDTQSKNPDAVSDYQALIYYMNVASALRNRRLIQAFGVCAELSKAFHIDLNDDEIVQDVPHYGETHSYTYDHKTREFFADIERTPKQIDWKNPPQYILDRIHKRQEMIKQEKKKIIHNNARIALKRLLAAKK